MQATSEERKLAANEREEERKIQGREARDTQPRKKRPKKKRRTNRRAPRPCSPLQPSAPPQPPPSLFFLFIVRTHIYYSSICSPPQPSAPLLPPPQPLPSLFVFFFLFYCLFLFFFLFSPSLQQQRCPFVTEGVFKRAWAADALKGAADALQEQPACHTLLQKKILKKKLLTRRRS